MWWLPWSEPQYLVLIQLSSVLLEKQQYLSYSGNSPHITEPKSSLTFSQQSHTYTYPGED